MKKQFIIRGMGVLGIIAFALLPSMIQSRTDEITVTISFSESDLRISKAHNYDLVELPNPNARLSGKSGEPWLPLYYARVLLPPGTCVSKATLNVLQSKLLEGNFHIYPTQPQYPVSSTKKYPFVKPDPKAYSLSTAQHPLHEKDISTMIAHGYTIASIPVSPVSYIPAKKELSLHTQIELSVAIKEDKKHRSIVYKKRNDMFQRWIEDEVLNPEIMDS